LLFDFSTRFSAGAIIADLRIGASYGDRKDFSTFIAPAAFDLWSSCHPKAPTNRFGNY
jgi:hypothetical protein